MGMRGRERATRPLKLSASMTKRSWIRKVRERVQRVATRCLSLSLTCSSGAYLLSGSCHRQPFSFVSCGRIPITLLSLSQFSRLR